MFKAEVIKAGVIKAGVIKAGVIAPQQAQGEGFLYARGELVEL